MNFVSFLYSMSQDNTVAAVISVLGMSIATIAFAGWQELNER